MEKPSIGILAGMGPSSTAPFLNLVLQECKLQYGAKDDIDFPQMMILSQPTPFYEDRPIDHAGFEAAVLRGLLQLQRNGVEILAIACNTAHIYYQSLCKAVVKPILNMVELATAELNDAGMKVAVMAARPTTESGIYHVAITEAGHEFIDVDWQDKIDELLGAVRTSNSESELSEKLADLFTLAEESQVDAVIVACLDLSGIPKPANINLQSIDASHCLAREIIRQYLKIRKHEGDVRAGGKGPDRSSSGLMAEHGDYFISTDASRLDVAAVHRYLTRSYWASGISLDFVERSIANSLCFGLYHKSGEQIGFARIITDRVTFAYLGDVYVLESHRGHGLGKWLVDTVKSHPDLRTARRFMLVTRDAQSLYAQFGFKQLEFPERVMEITRPNMYQNGAVDS